MNESFDVPVLFVTDGKKGSQIRKHSSSRFPVYSPHHAADEILF